MCHGTGPKSSSKVRRFSASRLSGASGAQAAGTCGGFRSRPVAEELLHAVDSEISVAATWMEPLGVRAQRRAATHTTSSSADASGISSPRLRAALTTRVELWRLEV
eukprot:7116095-Prymnesium_polylepis.1